MNPPWYMSRRPQLWRLRIHPIDLTGEKGRAFGYDLSILSAHGRHFVEGAQEQVARVRDQGSSRRCIGFIVPRYEVVEVLFVRETRRLGALPRRHEGRCPGGGEHRDIACREP
jgi:hypothetical protein